MKIFINGKYKPNASLTFKVGSSNELFREHLKEVRTASDGEKEFYFRNPWKLIFDKNPLNGFLKPESLKPIRKSLSLLNIH